MRKILSVGQFSADGISNTCLHRNWALKRYGEVKEVDSTLKANFLLYRIINRLFVMCFLPIHFPNRYVNNSIVEALDNDKYDILWIDKGVFVSAKTLLYAKKKQPDIKIIGYSPDNMAERHNQSQHFLDSLPYYDYYVTTKSYIINDLKEMGVKNVIFVNNAYEETFHHPYDISDDEKKRLGGEVGFIGSWESERCESIIYLAENGVRVRVWGGGKWLKYKNKILNLTIEDRGLFSEDYNKALSAFDISLCFLKKMNRDQQTTRTMEIPACGSMLMAERTKEHEMLFKDGEEAVFFSDNKELLNKCNYYLSHPEERIKISLAGMKRCHESGYSNYRTIRNVLTYVFNS